MAAVEVTWIRRPSEPLATRAERAVRNGAGVWRAVGVVRMEGVDEQDAVRVLGADLCNVQLGAGVFGREHVESWLGIAGIATVNR